MNDSRDMPEDRANDINSPCFFSCFFFSFVFVPVKGREEENVY